MKTTRTCPTHRILRPFALALGLAVASSTFAQSYTWKASGLDGAGTQNCLAIQPGGTGVILSAADVSGIQRSTDSGLTWQGANAGTPSGGPGKVAVVVWTNSTTHANTAYAGDTDGFLSSIDGGVTWSLLNGSLNFEGNGGTIRWPRSTGNLIACDQASSWPGFLYAGSVGSNGLVSRSTDGGSTWTTIFTNANYVRSVALDPSNSSILYVATFGGKIWKTTAAKTVGTGGWTQLTASPDHPEELLVLTDGTIFAAGSNGSTGGVWKSTNGGTSWTSLSVPTATGTTYLAIAGYGTGSTAVLYAGADTPAGSPGSAASIIKSTNGGTSWTNVTINNGASPTVHNEIGGAGGPPWWQMLAANAPYYELGNGSGDVDNIQIDPSNHSRVLTAGRAGVWGTTDAASNWYPMVAGLSVSVCNWACTDPNHPGRIYITDEDWIFFYSTDSGVTFNRNHPSGFGATGRPIFVDPANSMVYVGVLDDSTVEGNVFSNPDPTTGQAWTNEGLAAAINGNLGNKVRGVIAGRDGSNNVVILACVDGGQGIWRKVNGTWSQITTSIVPSGAEVVQFAWKQGSSHVFVYSKGSGLWRSDNYGGAPWTKIWATTSGGTNTGFLSEDPTTSGLLYVSTDSGVFRFTNADTTTGSPVNISSGSGPAHPGAMTLANGKLFCANQYKSGSPGAMYMNTSPSSSSTWSMISNTTNYPGQSEWPSGMAVDSAGTIYISEKDEGCMVGNVVNPPPAPTGLAATAGVQQVALTWNSSAGATSYNVKRSTTSGGPYTIVPNGNVTTTSFTDPGLTAGTTYYYVVTALGTGGESGNSNQASATPLLFSDNFAGGAGNWTADTGTWAVVSGSYQQSNAAGGIAHVNVAGSSSWSNYSVSVDITPLTFTAGSVGVSLYFADTNNRYIAQITPGGAANIKKDVANVQTTLASGTVTTASTYTVKFSVNSSHTLTMFVNGTQVAQATDGTSPLTAGTLSVNSFNSTANFDNVVVTVP